MKDTLKEADLMLAEIMGYATPDYPKWTQASLTFEENQRLNRERNQLRIGNIREGQYRKIKYEIEARSKANYEFLHPRRPDWWDAVVKAHLDLPEDVRTNITKEDIEFLVEYMHPDEVLERKAEDKRQAQARKEREARARKVRNDLVNIEQDKLWNPKAKRKFAETDDHDELAWKEDGDYIPKLIFKSKGDGGYWPWYYGKFRRMIDWIDYKIGHGKKPPQPLADAVSLGSSLNLSDPVFSAAEFSEGGYTVGYLSAKGKKASGKLRKALGLRDAYRDSRQK